jgi:hypothetical protein
MVEFARMILPSAIGLFSDRFLISLLSLIFLIEMADPEGAETGPLVRNLAYYGGDVQRFIAISAKTGAINALANLVLLVALGVDFPVVWCFLYFFLRFIPNVGFLISLIPPDADGALHVGLEEGSAGARWAHFDGDAGRLLGQTHVDGQGAARIAAANHAFAHRVGFPARPGRSHPRDPAHPGPSKIHRKPFATSGAGRHTGIGMMVAKPRLWVFPAEKEPEVNSVFEELTRVEAMSSQSFFRRIT